jgi:mannose-1-phosphate guanylyltransferase
MIVPVILSGGSGTRLWPLSTAERPKQFLPLIGDDSLFQQTLKRISNRNVYAPPAVVANVAHMDFCLDELSDYEGAQLVLEPCARNTAAAIVMAAAVVEQVHGPNSMILVMPSDHLIGDSEAFHDAVRVGESAAASGRMVTFGVVPRGPETGFGYLETGAPLEDVRGAFEVARFTEKPELATARAMVASGRHYWNAGIFLFRVEDFLRESAKHACEIHDCALRAVAEAERRGACILPLEAELTECPNASVDYAVMERSDSIAMVPLSADWSDVGSWDALADLGSDMSAGSLVTAVQSENCYVRSDGLKVGLLGVDDLVVVASGDHVLIMRRGHSQHIRQLVAKVAAEA